MEDICKCKYVEFSKVSILLKMCHTHACDINAFIQHKLTSNAFFPYLIFFCIVNITYTPYYGGDISLLSDPVSHDICLLC